MGRLSKQEKYMQETYIDSVFSLIKLSSRNNDEVKNQYDKFINNENENLTLHQKKYFKSLIFDTIPYSETEKKMLELLQSDISTATFSGKEFKNIQKFLRNKKLKQIEKM